MGYSTTNVKNWGSLIVVDEEGYSIVDGCTYDGHFLFAFDPRGFMVNQVGEINGSQCQR